MPGIRPTARVTALGALIAAAILATGCLTRPVKTTVHAENNIFVSLRAEKRWFGGEIEKNYDHPVSIASVRIAHLLSRIDLRWPAKDGGEREPAIRTEFLYEIAESVAEALNRATPNQEVVVMATRKERSFRVFDRTFLTSFVVYASDDNLFFHMSRTDWEVPERREADLPEPRIGRHPMKFRLLSGTAMTLVGPQIVAVKWRDPVFARPTRTKILPTGEVVRKTILLESTGDEPQPETGETAEAEARAPDPSVAPLPANLTPQTLRALADLEEARQTGAITETVYRVRRRAILEAN